MYYRKQTEVFISAAFWGFAKALTVFDNSVWPSLTGMWWCVFWVMHGGCWRAGMYLKHNVCALKCSGQNVGIWAYVSVSHEGSDILAQGHIPPLICNELKRISHLDRFFIITKIYVFKLSLLTLLTLTWSRVRFFLASKSSACLL